MRDVFRQAFADDRRRAVFNRFLDEKMTVRRNPAHRHEQIARLHGATIEADGLNLYRRIAPDGLRGDTFQYVNERFSHVGWFALCGWFLGIVEYFCCLNFHA